MESNIIRAIINLVNYPVTEVEDFSTSHIRINGAGESLERYVQNLFANTMNSMPESERLKIVSEKFSYKANQNNPPDFILRNGDAIEVKKIETPTSNIALNSSYPKAKLFSNSDMITAACRNCEDWVEKDIIYVVGVLSGSNLLSLCMVYGVDYAASVEIYERIKNIIKDGVLQIPGVEFSETKELGRVNRVDPLGITLLRVRGMWHIENPLKVFDYVYQLDESKDFNFMALINSAKYESFSQTERDELELLVSSNSALNIKNVSIKNPDNPAQLKDAVLITFSK